MVPRAPLFDPHHLHRLQQKYSTTPNDSKFVNFAWTSYHQVPENSIFSLQCSAQQSQDLIDKINKHFKKKEKVAKKELKKEV